MVTRAERPLRRHLGAVTKSSRGRGCLRTTLRLLVELQITSAVVKGGYSVTYTYYGCRPC